MPSKEGTLIRKIFSTSHRILLNQLLRVHTKGVEGKVLIVGAGHLDYSKFFESEKCTILHADLERFGCHIDFVVDAHELSSIGSQFDYIYMLEVVEHVEDPDTVFAECLACLKEQGKLVVSVPFMFHIHADPYDFWRYTDLGLKRKLGMFSQVCIKPFGNRLHCISDLITTGNKWLTIMRLFNHFFCTRPLSKSSYTCPSGYFLICRK